MKKVLVTGGLGYIGSHTVVELQMAGIEVVIIDNLSNSSVIVKDRIEEISGIPVKFYQADVGDFDALKGVFQLEPKIDAVIHFAAFKAVGESVDNPLLYYHNNISALITLLKVMETFYVQTIIFSSSCTVYGDVGNSPVNESQPIADAASPYGTTKIICEKLLFEYAALKPLKVVSLRYFNPVGAHESAKIGELPIGVPNNLVPYITQTAAGFREKLTVFGSDYSTADGTNIRDFIHVVDIAKAHYKAFVYSLTNSEQVEIFNLGTGTGQSVLDVIKSFEKVSGLSLKYEMGARRPGDVVKIWADATKASDKLGWTAKQDLDSMMRSAWNWQKTLPKG
ncbi:MAG: UDP-glucose 4-epimerase [Bacteroidia bacterium]|jgi:UDP-glucose 4-epimerase